MNTIDVRDMNYNQWLFWATAIPVTVVVVVVSLIGAGVLSIRDQRLALDWVNVQGTRENSRMPARSQSWSQPRAPPPLPRFLREG